MAELFGLADERHAPARHCPRATRSSSTSPPPSRSARRSSCSTSRRAASRTRRQDRDHGDPGRRVPAHRLRAIIQVEHDMDIVFGYSDRIIALHQGKVLADAAARGDPRRRARGGHGDRPEAGPVPDARGRGDRRLHPVEPHPAARLARGRRARGGLPGRPQRRGQDDHAPLDHGLSAAPAPGASRFRRRARSTAGAPTRSPSSASASRPRTAASSPTSRWPRTSRSRPGRARAAAPPPSGSTSPTGCSRCCAGTPRARGPDGGRRAKMFSIARALALDPEMLLLDEPFEGLSPAIIPAVSRGSRRDHPLGRVDPDRRVEHPPRARVRHPALRDRARRDHLRRAARAVRADAAIMRLIGGAA